MTKQLEVISIQARLSILWKHACEYDDIEPCTKFAIFSRDNPYVKAHNALCLKLNNLVREIAATT